MKKRAYLVLINENRVLVVKEFGDTLFKLPGGRLEDNENEVGALSREINEEIQVGLNTNEIKEIGTYESMGKDKIHYHTTLYTGFIEGSPDPDGEEIEEVGWYGFSDLLPVRADFKKNVLPLLKEKKLLQ